MAHGPIARKSKGPLPSCWLNLPYFGKLCPKLWWWCCVNLNFGALGARVARWPIETLNFRECPPLDIPLFMLSSWFFHKKRTVHPVKAPDDYVSYLVFKRPPRSTMRIASVLLHDRCTVSFTFVPPYHLRPSQECFKIIMWNLLNWRNIIKLQTICDKFWIIFDTST